MKIILNDNEPAYIPDPINLDRAIQELQRALKNNVSWLSRVYGRARNIPEKLNDKSVSYPKVYYGKKEYLNILLNDTVPAQAWFQTSGLEIPLDYHARNTNQIYQVLVSLIVWLNMENVVLSPSDYYQSELAKRDIHNILGRYPNVTIQKIYDENAKDIFREYTIEDKSQLLTHPKAGLRFDFYLTYNYDCP